MNVTVTFRHMPTSETLRAHAEQRAAKFMKYLRDPIDIHLVLSIEKIRQIAELNVQAKNFSSHALEESQDMYSSIDKVMGKMEEQLRRHKERIKDHKSPLKAYEALEATL